jgi:hypothetical protein
MARRKEYRLMATTPNYSWPTPDDTDLVKDGAGAIRDLGDAIDTTVDTVTGAITTRLDVSEDKGDIAVYDGTDYIALPVGTDEFVLTADATEPTGVAWKAAAGGGAYELITSGSLTGTTVNITNIPQTFKNILLRVDEPKTTAGSNSVLNVRVNNDSTTGYSRSTVRPGQSSFLTANTTQWTFGVVLRDIFDAKTAFELLIYNYTKVQLAGQERSFAAFGRDTIAASERCEAHFVDTPLFGGPIDEINLFLGAGDFSSGSFELLGEL